MAMPITAQAADTYVEPSVSVAAGYDSNRRLDPVEKDNQTGLELIGEAEFGSKTRTREAVLNAATHVNRYSDSELNSTDWFLDLDLLRRWRRDEVGLVTSYQRASTIETELGDTGRLEADRIREDWSISPSWTHQLSRRTQTTLSYGFTDVAFEEGQETDLSDYQEHFVESLVSHNLSRITSVYARADYIHFESEAMTTSDDVSFLVGLERELSRTLDVGAGLGFQHSDSEFLDGNGGRMESSDEGFVYEAYATWSLQRSTFTVEGSRSVQASARGALSEVERVSAAWTRSLTRAWDLNLSGAASRREFAPSGPAIGEDRVYYNAAARLVWRVRPRWQVDLAYQYRRQEFDDPQDGADTVTEDAADSNSLWLTMRYTWARMDLFR